MSAPLDRVIWTALTGRQNAQAEGGPLARRYLTSILPFAAARDTNPDALAALATLPRPGDVIVQVERSPVLPPGLASVRTGTILQMVFAGALPALADADIVLLGPADAEEMLSLARSTEPGPFTLRAQTLGTFRGIRINGRLAAMAGERFKLDGHSELSGVCTHPDYRGRGLARALSIAVTRDIVGRGEIPFLHAWTGNATAIGLYESIGYTPRETFTLIAATRPD